MFVFKSAQLTWLSDMQEMEARRGGAVGGAVIF